jgi:glycosyltransferase involved in cell wall biosynthesis
VSDEPRDMVVFVSIAAGLGGSTRSLATVLGALPPSVERVLFAPRAGTFLNLVRDRKLADRHIPIPMPEDRRLRRLSRVVAAARVARFARRNRASITAIHANGLQEVALVAFASFISGARTVMWIHDFEVYPWTRRLGPLLRWLLRNRSVEWLAVSSTARRMIAEAGLASENDVTIVTNPIDPEDVVGERPAPSDTFAIGFIAAADRRKGFHLLPEIDRLLADLPIRWEFFTSTTEETGDPVWAALRSLPPDRAVFNGKVADVRTAYARCDVVLCPSLKESFCRVAAEAMLNGIPVVASDIPPLRELIGNDEAGFLFPVEDVAAAASKLRQLALDPDLRRRQGEHGMGRSRSFHPARVVQQLSDSYGLQ